MKRSTLFLVLLIVGILSITPLWAALVYFNNWLTGFCFISNFIITPFFGAMYEVCREKENDKAIPKTRRQRKYAHGNVLEYDAETKRWCVIG